jgi:tyrosyl-tRNA synthetase
MSTYKSEFLHILAERGFIKDVSEPEALDALASEKEITAYIGFDCTAASLHVGSLLPIMMLFWLQQTGHRPIALMGGGTTRVGDPSGKDESRKILTAVDIESNLKGIRAIFSKCLRFRKKGALLTPLERNDIERAVTRLKMSKTAAARLHAASDTAPNLPPGVLATHLSSKHSAIMANNADWLNALNYIDFLRDVGRHFSINRMLTFDSVKLRLDRHQELSFLEFNYMMLQAYDFVELYQRYGCVLQMGGSDQWGNIVNGTDLGRRLHNAQLFALTAPLITTSSGAKMGKTAAGAVWLNADQVSPYDYWQYWRNTEDADVERFLKLFTVLPLEEIARLAALRGQDINEAKKVLATEATTLVHGRAAADEAAATARTTFEKGGMGADLPSIYVNIGDSILSTNTNIGFSSSNAIARQFVKDGAVYLGDRKISDISYKLREEDFGPDRRALLKLGNKKRGILKLKSE